MHEGELMSRIFWVGAFPPQIPSVGDHAQILAIQKWFKEYFPNWQVTRFCRQLPKLDIGNWDRLLRTVNDDDLIFINSGCDFGNLYSISHENVRKKIISAFPNNKIIQLPVTVFYNHATQITEDAEFFTNRNNVVLMGRDPKSYEILAANLECKSLFVPDFAFRLKATPTKGARKGALLILRRDFETKPEPDILLKIRRKLPRSFRKPISLFIRVYTVFTRYVLKKMVEQAVSNVVVKDVQIGTYPITDENRESIINEVLDYYQNFQVVVTDRLHGMIFGVLTKTPCVAIEGKIPHKISGYKKLLSHSVTFVNSIWKVPNAIREALSKPYQTTDLTPYFKGLRKRIFDPVKVNAPKTSEYQVKPSDLMELIKGRRSIRKWHSQEVEEDKIKKILTAGIYAPTASNYQATRFHVVRDEMLIAEICNNSAPWFKHNHPNKIIVVLFDVEKPHPLGFNFKKQRFKKPHAWVRFIWQDSAVAMMNMMLMAEALGLKTCWQSVEPKQLGPRAENIRKLLKIPSRYVLACLLFLGYGDRKSIGKARHYGVPVKRKIYKEVMK